jgi:hypothetical protein
VSSRAVAFRLLLSITSLNILSLVHLFHVHRSLAYKYPLGELLQIVEVLVYILKLVVMNMMICEVEQPPA